MVKWVHRHSWPYPPNIRTCRSFGSFIYAITRSRVGLEPLARPQMLDGSSTYSGVLFVRKDSGIKNIEDLRGQTIALVEPSTTGGYLGQKEILQHHGIDVDKNMKIIWKGSHEEVITAVMLQEATAGGAKDSAVRKYTENRHFSQQIRVLARSPKESVPENALALRSSISPAIRTKIKDALLSMHRDPAGRRALASFGARRFIETTDADYRPLYNLVNHMKIDLQSCSYQRP